MANYLRAIAGCFTGAGSLMLLYFGLTMSNPHYVATGSTLLGAMMGFFVGEVNGQRKSS